MYTNYKYAPTFDAETFCCCLCGMHAVAGPGSVGGVPGLFAMDGRAETQCLGKQF